jgi:predicted ArsR family transcriptional regulator
MGVHTNRRFEETTRGRIATLLRAAPMTIDDLASRLDLTGNAVRAHIQLLEADGLVRRAGVRETASKPSVTYALSEHAERQYSSLYVPFLTSLLHVLDEKLDARAFDAVLRRTAKTLLVGRARPTGSVPDRVRAASELLNAFGGLTRVERSKSGYVIRSHGCPLSAATEHHPEACNAVESLLREYTGLSVSKCCQSSERMRCCFEVAAR